MGDDTTRRLFSEAHVAAERTVAKLRVAVAVVMVAGVMALVVQPALAEHDPALEPQVTIAVWSSAAFLLHGLLTYGVVRSGRYRSWMAWVFATVDVALLLGSLTLVLGVTSLAGAWLPAVPVLWLAPLILAFGALRYDPWVQGWVTLLLVGGLLGLGFQAGPVTQAAAPASLVEESPNLMRVVMLLLSGAVLVVSARRARGLLARAVEEFRRRQNLTRYLPPQIADRLADASMEEITRGSRQPAAVLFTDIRGFTRRAEAMTPEAVGAFVSEFRRRVTACADAHDGVVDKFIGDAAMVVFGVPDPDDAAARNAIACARGLLALVDQWNEDLARAGDAPVAVGVGVHWGEVFCGAVGDRERLEFTVLGDTVNVAARLQDECKTRGLSLIVSAEALEQAGEAPLGWVAVPPQPLRGRDGDIRLFGHKPYTASLAAAS